MEDNKGERKSKDKVVGNGGKKLVEWVQERGWYILNGTMEGDWEGEYTYIGARGSTVIYYVIINEKAKNEITGFRIGDRVDSDHMPLIVELKEEEERRGKKKGKRNRKKEKEGGREEEEEFIAWNKEAIERYKEKAEELCRRQIKENRWKKMAMVKGDNTDIHGEEETQNKEEEIKIQGLNRMG